MKTQLIPKTTDFQPVTLQITLETQAELNALAKLFNCQPLHSAMVKIGGEMPSYTILNDLASSSSSGDLLDALKATTYIQTSWRPAK